MCRNAASDKCANLSAQVQSLQSKYQAEMVMVTDQQALISSLQDQVKAAQQREQALFDLHAEKESRLNEELQELSRQNREHQNRMSNKDNTTNDKEATLQAEIGRLKAENLALQRTLDEVHAFTGKGKGT